ncbi:MAG: carbohydrate ABC transporter permease [Acidimicrobiales bacterium]
MRSSLAGRLGYYGVNVVLAVVFLFPLVWAGWVSLRGRPGSGQASGFGFGNYTKFADFGEGLSRFVYNSVAISVMTVAFTLVVSTLGGYAFGRFDFPGKNVLFLATLAILMVPVATLLVPLFELLGWIGLSNSLLGVSLALTMFQLPFATFMMRNSFEAVPRELEEAAIVDGASSFTALLRVMLPAVRPGLITVGLFAFLASWNDFITPLILLPDSSKHPLPVATFNSATQQFGTIDYGALQAGVMIMAIPCLILFVVLQRHYVAGFTTGAIK